MPTYKTYRNFVSDENFLQLTVYILYSSILHIMETESYTVTQLVSDVGGLLSLWTEVSIITLVEMAELTISLMQECCKPRHKEVEKDTSGKHTNPEKEEVSNIVQTSEHKEF